MFRLGDSNLNLHGLHWDPGARGPYPMYNVENSHALRILGMSGLECQVATCFEALGGVRILRVEPKNGGLEDDFTFSIG